MKLEERYKIYQSLERHGYIDFNKTIPKDVLESLFGVKYIDDWVYLGPLLAIKQVIEEEGYQCTRDNAPEGALRIYDISDMMLASDRKFKNLMSHIERLQRSLRNTPVSDFDNKELNKHMHITNKIGIAINALSSALTKI